MMEAANNITDPVLSVAAIGDLLSSPGLEILQERLVSYLPSQRWFGAKSRAIKTVEVIDSAEFPGLDAAIVFLRLTHDDGSTSVYQFGFAISSGEEAERIRASNAASIVAAISTPAGPAILHDAVAREAVRQAILNLIETNGELITRTGTFHGRRSSAFEAIRGAGPLPGRTGSAEQSNTSILYGGKLIMKLFRRLQPGENPDTEIGRFLTETAHFTRIAPFLGDITLISKRDEQTTVAMLQGLVENEGDGWQWTLDELAHYYDRVASLPLPQHLSVHAGSLIEQEPATLAREHTGPYLDAATLLGRRTAEMHLALATPTENPAFAAEPFKSEDLTADASRIETQLSDALEALKRGMSGLTGGAVDTAALILRRRADLLSRARAITSVMTTDFGERIRIHGDYHLGQILRSHGDYIILDFEGEPARSLVERKAKQSPLKDVAGMLRSFSYAAYSALNAFAERGPGEAKKLEPWANLWQNAVSTEFLRAYRTCIDGADSRLVPRPEQAQLLLNAYLLEKALYELLYELNNRQSWVWIPLAGILGLLQ
jgi:maltose alpha-D-glucosyltransferase / alpha-amylase